MQKKAHKKYAIMKTVKKKVVPLQKFLITIDMQYMK